MKIFRFLMGRYFFENYSINKQSWDKAVFLEFNEFRKRPPNTASRSHLDGAEIFRRGGILISAFILDYHVQTKIDGIEFVPGKIRTFVGCFLILFLAGAIVTSLGMLIENQVPILMNIAASISIEIILLFLVFVHRSIAFALYRNDLDKSL